MLIQFDGSGEGADESPDVDGGGEYFKFTVLDRADVLGLDLCDLCDLMNIESQRFPCLSEPFRYRGHLGGGYGLHDAFAIALLAGAALRN